MKADNNGLRILVIEDDEDTNQMICDILSDSGFTTLTAFNGEEGISLAASEQPDVILLDLMLPTIDGIEVCRRLMDDPVTLSIPVIILTAKDELSTKLYSFVAGAKRFITKPFQSQELILEIERTLRQKQIQNIRNVEI